MKKYYPFLVMFLFAVASLFIAYSVSPSDFDSVYSLSNDVVPILIDPDDMTPVYRWYDGKLQVRYSTASSWEDVSSPVELVTMLNYLGVATLSDIPTSEDFTNSIKGYFGTPFWPLPYSIQWPGFSSSQTFTANSLAHQLSQMHVDLNADMTLYPGFSRLSSSGRSLDTVVANSLAYVNAQSFIGLATLLGGGTSSSYSYLSSNGMSSFGSQPYLLSLNDGIQGLGTLLLGSLTSDRTFSLYVPGQDNPIDYSYSDLSSLFNYYFSNDSRILTTTLPYLNAVGITQNAQGSILGLADIVAYGFNGISHNLIGDMQSGYDYQIVDYTDMSVTNYHTDNILEYLVTTMSQIQSDLAMYLYSHGTDLDIKERENMQQQAEQFVDDFTDPNGQGTPTTGNISDTAGVSGGIKDVFKSSSTPADAFGQLSDDDNYNFLSSEIQNQLNPRYNGSRSFSSDDEAFYDFVSDRLNDIIFGAGSSW